MVDVGEIRGIKGLLAFKAMHTLLFGYFLLPEHRKGNENYDKFLRRFSEMTEAEKREVFNQALYVCGIDEKEIITLAEFCKDANGIPYNKQSLVGAPIDDVFNIVIDVCLAVASVKVFF